MTEAFKPELTENDRRLLALPDRVKVYIGLNNALTMGGLSLEAEVKLKMERFNLLLEMPLEEQRAMGEYLAWKNKRLYDRKKPITLSNR